jgi:hypothetical protein
MSLLIYCYAECHYAECRYPECHYTECCYAECRYAECRYAERHYTEWRYAECRYAECHGTYPCTLRRRCSLRTNVRRGKKHTSLLFRGGFVEHLSRTYVAQLSVTKVIYLVLIHLVTPKARAKHEPFVQQTGLRLVILSTEKFY